LATALFVGFVTLLGSLTWIQVVAVDRYRDDPRNLRTAISESGKERGVIVTLDGTLLAYSETDSEDPQSYRRIYPQGEAFAPVVGYTSRQAGSAGLEDAYADVLRSRRDLTFSDLLSAVFGRDLNPRSIQVTIEPELQRLAYELLDGQRGAVVALQPTTGEVLAYVTAPSYDPQSLTAAEPLAVRQDLLDDPAGPLRDRAGAELVRPGSSFKAVVAAAAFDSGLFAPDTELVDASVYTLPGTDATIANFSGGFCNDGRTVTIQVAFTRSCNTTFADLAVQVGAEHLGATAEALGFNGPIDLPWPTAASTFLTEDLARDPAALAQSGIGERDVQATPLQMALVAAAIANRGELMEPQVVSQVFDADGETIEMFEPRTEGQAISVASADVLITMMERVVTEGTGTRAAVPGVRVAGKTGTAQIVGGSGPHVWFIGFAPVDAPTIALAVMVEDGGESGDSATGGSVAAPIAAELMERWLEIRS
jgi:peptidoglycan glycosyltransferase